MKFIASNKKSEEAWFLKMFFHVYFPPHSLLRQYDMKEREQKR